MGFKIWATVSIVGIIGIISVVNAVSGSPSCERYGLEGKIAATDISEPEYDRFLKQEKSYVKTTLEAEVDMMSQQGVTGQRSDSMRQEVFNEIESRYSAKEWSMIKRFNNFNTDLAEILEVNSACGSDKVQVSAEGEAKLANYNVELSNGTEVSAKIIEVGEKSFNPYRKDGDNIEITLGNKTVTERESEADYFNLTQDAAELEAHMTSYIEEQSEAEKMVVIGVKDSETLPYVQSAVKFWRNNKEHMKWNASLLVLDYDEEMANKEFEYYDVVIEREEQPCNREDALGCAPLIEGDRYVESPATISIKSDLRPALLEETIRHELGHLFGLSHGEGPNDLMEPEAHITRIS